MSGIFLRDGAITVGLDPACGGALTRFDVRRGDAMVNVLRPSTAQPPGVRCALGAACFPLVPYGGRLREGCFDFDGRRFQYPLNALPERHSSHGDGWSRSWALSELHRRHAVMRLDADPSAPVQYSCIQSVRLEADRVRITLTARNLSRHRLPIGLGLHPYFANRSDAHVRMSAPTRWRWDPEMMPVAEEVNPDAGGFLRGQRVTELPVAAEYAAWDGAAIIDWPASQLRVTLETRPRLRHVVMWLPAGHDFFCFEPVSHASDGLNRPTASGHLDGFQVLEPNATAEQHFDFRISTPACPSSSGQSPSGLSSGSPSSSGPPPRSLASSGPFPNSPTPGSLVSGWSVPQRPHRVTHP